MKRLLFIVLLIVLMVSAIDVTALQARSQELYTFALDDERVLQFQADRVRIHVDRIGKKTVLFSLNGKRDSMYINDEKTYRIGHMRMKMKLIEIKKSRKGTVAEFFIKFSPIVQIRSHYVSHDIDFRSRPELVYDKLGFDELKVYFVGNKVFTVGFDQISGKYATISVNEKSNRFRVNELKTYYIQDEEFTFRLVSLKRSSQWYTISYELKSDDERIRAILPGGAFRKP